MHATWLGDEVAFAAVCTEYMEHRDEEEYTKEYTYVCKVLRHSQHVV